MKTYSEAIVFGKIISTALLVIGYILMGFFIGRKLTSMGYPTWLEAALPVIGALIGAHQGYLFLREIIRKLKK